MQIFRTTANEMRRILCSTGFWISVGLALIILLTSTAYEEEDGTTHTVLAFAFEYSKDEMLSYNQDLQGQFTIVRYALPMYGPLLAALAFASTLCEERKYGVRRYIVFQEGRVPYVLSKAFSACIASGLVFLISALLFLLFLYWRYPLRSEGSVDSFLYWMEYQMVSPSGEPIILFEWFGEHAFCILQLAGTFLYGMFSGFIGYICTIFFSNVYLAVCIPFFFGYIYYSITQAIMARAMEGSISWDTYNAINSYVSPEGYMYFWRMTDSFVVNMVVLLLVWVAAIGIHMLQIHKTTDCGVK